MCTCGAAEQAARAPAAEAFTECEDVFDDESDEAEVGEDQSKFYDEMLEDKSQQWLPQGTWAGCASSLTEAMNSQYARDVMVRDLKAQTEQDMKAQTSLLAVRRPLPKTGSTDFKFLPNSAGERKIFEIWYVLEGYTLMSHKNYARMLPYPPSV